MKRLTVFPMLACLVALGAHAQQKDSVEFGWSHSVVAGLTLTQIALTDWTQGGDNALGWALSVDGKSTNELPQTNWTSSGKFGFGQTRLATQGLRKTDDRIELESILTLKVGTYINPYTGATLKTQFAEGFKYDNAGNGVVVSKFFDPAFLTQSAGVGYQPINEVKTRLGVALREILTSEFPLYADDPATAATEKTSVQGGLESVTDVEWKVDDNVLFTSKLEMFSPFKAMDEIVVRNDNTLAAKVNKYITAILNVQLINEKRISPRTQIKETIALGLSYTLL